MKCTKKNLKKLIRWEIEADHFFLSNDGEGKMADFHRGELHAFEMILGMLEDEEQFTRLYETHFGKEEK